MLRGMCVVCGAVTHTHAQEHKQLCRRGRPSWQRPLIMALRVFALRKPFLGFPTGSLCSRARQAYSTVPYSRHNSKITVSLSVPPPFSPSLPPSPVISAPQLRCQFVKGFQFSLFLSRLGTRLVTLSSDHSSRLWPMSPTTSGMKILELRGGASDIA